MASIPPSTFTLIETLSLMRELTHAVDHQVRNAHQAALTALQSGDPERSREGLQRVSGFLDALAGLTAPFEDGENPAHALHRRIQGLKDWKPPAPPPARAEERRSLPSGERVSVLYVEDDSDAGELISMFLSDLDFIAEVHWKTNVAGALEVFARHPGLHVLVTDFHLEEALNGLDLVRELRRRNPGLKALVTSGSLEEMGLQMTDEEKAELHFLPKPFDLPQLEEQLREVSNPSRGRTPAEARR